MTIQELAQSVYDQFDTDTRNDGTKFWKRTDRHEQDDWVTELCHAAHGDMFPDDWKYEFIVSALRDISDADDDDLDDLIGEIEPDIYTNERLRWLASNLNRPYYVDQAIAEFGHAISGIVEDIGLGQMMEKQEVFSSVLQSLRDHLDEIEDAA